jgi:hypothetical protein
MREFNLKNRKLSGSFVRLFIVFCTKMNGGKDFLETALRRFFLRKM